VFAKEISKYIDSKDQQRGEKKDKDKEPGEKRDKEKEKAERQKERERREKMAAEPALWPLIRLVQVRCPSKALSTGAILVDLPGVADANAARGNIAKDYMKKCNCIWIAAPITRYCDSFDFYLRRTNIVASAVDDKTAKDLLGDAFKTQLMSKFLFAIDPTTLPFLQWVRLIDSPACAQNLRIVFPFSHGQTESE
jgi:hypothetical protein